MIFSGEVILNDVGRHVLSLLQHSSVKLCSYSALDPEQARNNREEEIISKVESLCCLYGIENLVHKSIILE